MAGDDSDKDKASYEIDWSKLPVRKPPPPEEIPQGGAPAPLRIGPPPPPVPTTDRALPEISSDEYQGWLTPEAMLAAMPYGLSNHAQLQRELRADRYRGAADEVFWTIQGYTGRDRFALLPSWIWLVGYPEATSDFWRTGYLEPYVPKDPNMSLFDGNTWRLYGVRFWYPGLQSTPPPTPDTDLAGKPNVARADLAKWHEIFVAVHPNAPEALALQSAAAMFPDKTVPRQWVRDLRGPQKRGKPPSRQK